MSGGPDLPKCDICTAASSPSPSSPARDTEMLRSGSSWSSFEGGSTSREDERKHENGLVGRDGPDRAGLIVVRSRPIIRAESDRGCTRKNVIYGVTKKENREQDRTKVIVQLD